ncbi:MAG TPA: hypothetical protein VIO64_09880 [Pseudobacteroides sp.]|uniref:hypothetical protein n=1 Tax=Pseudobacteroides sp. TaxID=1968840 RepID=UPI002F922AA1
MKKKSIFKIVSIIVVIAIFSPLSFAASTSFDDLLSSASDYFSADFFSVSDGYKLDLGMKDQILKTIISNMNNIIMAS